MECQDRTWVPFRCCDSSNFLQLYIRRADCGSERVNCRFKVTQPKRREEMWHLHTGIFEITTVTPCPVF